MAENENIETAESKGEEIKTETEAAAKKKPKKSDAEIERLKKELEIKEAELAELNDKYITGLMPIDSMDLLDYKPGDQIKVQVKEFEIQEGKEPFVLNKRGQVTNCNTRCVFEIAQ